MGVRDEFTLIEGVEPNEYINLSQKLVKEPLNAYIVGTNHFGIANYNKRWQYLITYDISSCIAVICYSPKKKIGLIVHIYPTKIDRRSLKYILDEFSREGGSFRETEVTLLWGGTSRESLKGYVQLLVSILKSLHPRVFRVDSSKTNEIRHVQLNLKNGEVNEIDGNRGWSRSTKRNTSIERDVPSKKEK